MIPLHTQHYMMLQRNLLYTGMTRGKKLVCIVGNRKALEMAVQRQDTGRRDRRAATFAGRERTTRFRCPGPSPRKTRKKRKKTKKILWTYEVLLMRRPHFFFFPCFFLVRLWIPLPSLLM